MKRYKKTILIDLDGVLNTYDGKYDENIIPPMRIGAFEFVQNLSKDYIIKIFTTRNMLQTAKWVYENKLDEFVTDITNVKEPSHLIIDDRCINFKGNYSNLENEIKNFKVWYK